MNIDAILNIEGIEAEWQKEAQKLKSDFVLKRIEPKVEQAYNTINNNAQLDVFQKITEAVKLQKKVDEIMAKYKPVQSPTLEPVVQPQDINKTVATARAIVTPGGRA